jgi:hypothetical protein
MAFSFNGAAKLISLSPSTTSLSVRDLWSRWNDWLAVGDNSKYAPAFDTVGGNAIDAAAGTSIPIYCFMLNGWKIRPQEADHTLTVSDGVLLTNDGSDPFINPSGSFVVRIRYQQPVQAIAFATGGGTAPTAEQNAAAVWSHNNGAMLVARLAEVWARLGLDASKPVAQNNVAIGFGDIILALTESDGIVTVARQ